MLKDDVFIWKVGSIANFDVDVVFEKKREKGQKGTKRGKLGRYHW
jgi:hypothetical protein